jgi:hypothetical protein
LVHLYRLVKPFIIWFYPPLLDYDVSMHRLVELVVVIPMSQRSLKTESECSSYDHFGFRCFCLFQGQRLQTRRAKDSGPKCVFAVFHPEYWSGTSGYFSRPKSPAPRDRRLRPKSPDLQNSRCRSAQRWGRRLVSPCPESPPTKGRRLRRKWSAMTIFVGRPIKGPLLPPWVAATPSLSSIVDLE